MFNDNKIIIVDNFLDNPFLVRLSSITQKFYSKENHPNKETIQFFPGKRSEELSKLNPKFFRYFILKMSKFMGYSNIHLQASLSFNYLTKNDLLQFHTDTPKNDFGQIYAGVLYLNKSIQKEYGTIIGETQIEAKYNRLILYNGSVPHSPTKAFGTNRFNSRMTMNLFYQFINHK
jgi:hypothetical protein